VVNRKTKKKRKTPLIRLAFLIILILAAGFFIFYSIDNPQFIRSLFNLNQSGEETANTVEEIPSIGGPEEGSEDTSTEGTDGDEAAQEVIEESISDDGDSPEVYSEAEVIANEGESGSLSLWQRILEFFRKRSETADTENAYPSRLIVNIYFASAGEEKKLASEERSIRAGSPGNALNNAANELLKGPVKSYHFPVIPAGTKLLGAKAYDGVAEIDLSGEFLENSLDSRILDEYIIYSIVNTATEIPDINGVIFFIEGKRIKMYGNIDLSIPLIRDPDFLEEESEQ